MKIDQWVGKRIVSVKLGQAYGKPAEFELLESGDDLYENEFIIELDDGTRWSVSGRWEDGVLVDKWTEPGPGA